jgi:hypothetical protein
VQKNAKGNQKRLSEKQEHSPWLRKILLKCRKAIDMFSQKNGRFLRKNLSGQGLGRIVRFLISRNKRTVFN